MAIPKTWTAFHVKYHLVSVFTDDGVELITYKFWRKHKQRWEYRTAPQWLVEREISQEGGRPCTPAPTDDLLGPS